jgi:hypothetical protein
MNVDIFRPIPRDARRENLAAYQQFLVARDGTMDLEKRQLSLREEGMTRYERPLSRVREIDRGLFAAQYASFDARVETSPELLLLLALVKINAAEAFGVNQTYQTVLQRALRNRDTCELIVLCEETYHTRILVSTAQCYGIEIGSAYHPPTALRALITAIGITPMVLSRPLVLASEVLAVLMFMNLLEKSRVVLRHDPELRDGVEERLCEIITDEIGHMSFNRAGLGAAGMAQARMLLPMVAMGMSGAFPEMNALGTMSAASGDEVASLTTGRRLPEQVVKSAFIC